MLDYPRYGENSCYFVESYLNGKYGKNISAKLASMFYALDRFDDSYNFSQRSEEYDFIISNRYVSANMIHQTGKIVEPTERVKFLDWLYELEYEICGIPKPDKVLFLDVPPDISQKLIEKKEQREYITDGGNKDIHEADENHLRDAYSAAQEVLHHYPDWIRVECCENGEILPIEVITQKILSEII